MTPTKFLESQRQCVIIQQHQWQIIRTNGRAKNSLMVTMSSNIYARRITTVTSLSMLQHKHATRSTNYLSLSVLLNTSNDATLVFPLMFQSVNWSFILNQLWFHATMLWIITMKINNWLNIVMIIHGNSPLFVVEFWNVNTRYNSIKWIIY